MESDAHTNAAAAVGQIVVDMNQAWSQGHPEKLDAYFHEDIMVVSPEGKTLGQGKAACIQSYSDFLTKATGITFTVSEPDVDVWGHTAVASYAYQFAWEMDGQSHDETGRDIFVFTYEDGKWLAVWRKLSPK